MYLVFNVPQGNMKQFIASTYLVCIFFCGWTFNKQNPNQIGDQNSISTYLSLGKIIFSDDFYYCPNFPNIEGSERELTQTFASLKHKFPLNGLSEQRNLELLYNKKIAECLLHSKCFGILFEGPDIIHPFNYFW